MLRIVETSAEDVFSILRQRTIKRDAGTQKTVQKIIEDVRQRGDEALLEQAREHDSPDLQSLVPREDEYTDLPKAHRRALERAALRIATFHREQFRIFTEGLDCEGGPGRDLMYGADDQPFVGSWATPAKGPLKTKRLAGQRVLPLKRVGIYVPGGQANYPSSVLMNGVPARIAGVREFVICSPAQRVGILPSSVLHATRFLAPPDRLQVIKCGGAAAVAAMALGTESISRVDKLVGPGNRFLNEAKRQLWGTVGLDGYAGPSEVAVLADDDANATFAAADLLTQIEHAPDNAGFLICLSRSKLQEILEEVVKLLQGTPRMKTMATALRKESLAIVVRDLEEACSVVDAISPEHLSIMTSEPERVMTRISNAGCILLGETTPESAADWVIGPSHTLPTSGGARYASPLNVLDFLKIQSVAKLDEEKLRDLLPTIEAFGEMEGFDMHANSASLRLAPRPQSS